MRCILLIGLIALQGCSPEPIVIDLPQNIGPKYTIKFRIDTTMDEHGYSGIDLAADFLEASKIFHPLDAEVIIDDNAPMALMCATWDQGTAVAVQNGAGIAVQCMPVMSLYEQARLHILAHEIGHAFGMHHVEDTDALMHIKTFSFSRLKMTLTDLAEWYRVHEGI